MLKERNFKKEKTMSLPNVSEEEVDIFTLRDSKDYGKSLPQPRKISRKEEEGDPFVLRLLRYTLRSTAGEPKDNHFVFTETEHFIRGLRYYEEITKPKPEDLVDEDNVKFVEQEMGAEFGVRIEVNNNNNIQSTYEERVDIPPYQVLHEAVVGKGLAGALRFLKDHGSLEGDNQHGRNMDRKKRKHVSINNNDWPKELRIGRTDEFG